MAEDKRIIKGCDCTSCIHTNVCTYKSEIERVNGLLEDRVHSDMPYLTISPTCSQFRSKDVLVNYR